MKKVILATAAAAAILVVGAQAQASANLLTNGSFETGSFTGWSQGGITADTGVSDQSYSDSNFFSLPPEQGNYFAYLGQQTGPGTLSQTVSDSIGKVYTVTGWYAGQGSGYTNYLSITVGGNGLLNLVPGPQDGVWHEVTGTFVGTGSDTLTITSYEKGGYNFVDNFSISAVPEPATWTIMLLGVFGVGAAMRGARRKAMADAASA